jgi:hypothetical protein
MKPIITKHAIERLRSFGITYSQLEALLDTAISWPPSHHSKKDDSITLKNGPYLFVMDKERKVLITVYDQRLNLKAAEL